MKVVGLAVDPVAKVPIVVLKEADGERAFPIWIGPSEASAIATCLDGLDLPRPLTHDLLIDLVDSLGGTVEQIEVTALRDNTFYAVIRIRSGVETLEVDSRPSDAIAIALRTGAEILADESVLEQAQQVRIRTVTAPAGIEPCQEVRPERRPAEKPGGGGAKGPRILDPSTPADKWDEVLEGLSPEDFGKYKM